MERQRRLAFHQKKGIRGNTENIKCKLCIYVCAWFFKHTYVYVISIKHQNGKLGIAIRFVPRDKKKKSMLG